MAKLIASMNITIDGYCDHTYGIADEELHQHYADMLNNAEAVIYGRITYQLMEDFWPTLVKQPSGEKAMDDFAASMENVHKIVYSRTLKEVTWHHSTLKSSLNKDEILQLKKDAERDVFVGSPGMIVALTQLKLIDEYQLCIHPVVAGKGLPLFKNMNEMFMLKLLNTRTFGAGQILHYYQPVWA